MPMIFGTYEDHDFPDDIDITFAMKREDFVKLSLTDVKNLQKFICKATGKINSDCYDRIQILEQEKRERNFAKYDALCKRLQKRLDDAMTQRECKHE